MARHVDVVIIICSLSVSFEMEHIEKLHVQKWILMPLNPNIYSFFFFLMCFIKWDRLRKMASCIKPELFKSPFCLCCFLVPATLTEENIFFCGGTKRGFLLHPSQTPSAAPQSDVKTAKKTVRTTLWICCFFFFFLWP